MIIHARNTRENIFPNEYELSLFSTWTPPTGFSKYLAAAWAIPDVDTSCLDRASLGRIRIERRPGKLLLPIFLVITRAINASVDYPNCIRQELTVMQHAIPHDLRQQHFGTRETGISFDELVPKFLLPIVQSTITAQSGDDESPNLVDTMKPSNCLANFIRVHPTSSDTVTAQSGPDPTYPYGTARPAGLLCCRSSVRRVGRSRSGRRPA
jgi:hypothetical protein